MQKIEHEKKIKQEKEDEANKIASKALLAQLEEWERE